MFAFGDAGGSKNNTDSAKLGRSQYRLPATGREIIEDPAAAALAWRWRRTSTRTGTLRFALACWSRRRARSVDLPQNLQKKAAADIRGGCRGPEQPPELARW